MALRLIIAYGLIALMIFGIGGAVLYRRRKQRMRRDLQISPITKRQVQYSSGAKPANSSYAAAAM